MIETDILAEWGVLFSPSTLLDILANDGMAGWLVDGFSFHSISNFLENMLRASEDSFHCCHLLDDTLAEVCRLLIEATEALWLQSVFCEAPRRPPLYSCNWKDVAFRFYVNINTLCPSQLLLTVHGVVPRYKVVSDAFFYYTKEIPVRIKQPLCIFVLFVIAALVFIASIC